MAFYVNNNNRSASRYESETILLNLSYYKNVINKQIIELYLKTKEKSENR